MKIDDRVRFVSKNEFKSRVDIDIEDIETLFNIKYV